MNRHKNAFVQLGQAGKVLSGALLAVLALGISDTARAQGVTLAANPMQLTFNVAKNASSQAQVVSLTASQATTVIIQVSQTSTWLTVNPSGGLNITGPTNVAASVNTNGLNSGTYQGSFTVSVNGQSQNQIVVSVTLNVGTSSGAVITATPSTLSFSAQQGSTAGTPASRLVQIATTGTAFAYSLTATTQGGGNWLQLDHIDGATGDVGFNVNTNPSGLAGGVYTGTIVATSKVNASDSVQVPVTLTVNSNATVSVTPTNPPPFLFQIGGTVPSPQTLAVSAANGSVAYTVQVTPAVNWLVVSPLQGVAGASPSNLTLSVSPGGFQAGTYNTNVVITPSNGSAVSAIPISLVVSANALLTVATNTLNFTGQFAGQPPPDQTVAVTAIGTGSAVGFSSSVDINSPWLTASTSGNTTPATLTVHVNPSGLSVGPHVGTITIRPSNGDNYSQVLTVNFTVANASQLTAAPPLLLFSYQIGQVNPGSQTIQLSSNAAQTAFTLATATDNCGSNWLNASPLANTTPTTINVTVLTTGLTASTPVCTGKINISYGSSQTLSVPITLGVSTTPQLAVSLPAGFGTYTAIPDATLPQQTISLTSTDPNTKVQYQANSQPGWISLANNFGSTPQSLAVSISAVGLPASSTPYQGSIVISSASLPNGSIIIPIFLTVTPNTVVTVTPSGTLANPITFSQPQGAAAPASQTLTLASTGGTATFAATVTTSNNVDWLGVSPPSGNASGPLTVSIKSNQLSQGTYTGQIILSLQNAAATSLTINVVLNVTAPQNLIVNPTSGFTFTYQLGGAQPAPQRFRVTSGGSPLTFQVASASTPSGWLSTDVTTGTTDKDVNIQVNATGLAQGSYNGTVTISAPGNTGPVTLNVVLTVVAPAPPVPNTITNSASVVAGVIAPGEILSIFGSGMGPAKGVGFTLNSAGGVDPTLGGVQVLFNNKPGTPIYVSATQINVIVPYEANGQASTSMVVQYLGVSSAPFNLNVAQRAPGIYTVNGQGFGQVAALNQNGTFNGTGANGTTPASPDTTVVLYATGGGQTSPASITGSVTPGGATLYRVPNVTATVGGQPAVVEFAGGAPGLVAGAIQLNIHLPKGLTGDALTVVVSIDGVSSPLTGAGGQGPTVAVR